ncbi:unnamed protein product [Prorocentrum cordatum]|uniref:Rhamnosyl O-methyltransferase n=1 Tax=Prorocentrum cordatum TaxID=2364126 RepID=A0ABN9TDE7_9DINO|nr:unnamed protein product [Polarella glacialis]
MSARGCWGLPAVLLGLAALSLLLLQYQQRIHELAAISSGFGGDCRGNATYVALLEAKVAALTADLAAERARAPSSAGDSGVAGPRVWPTSADNSLFVDKDDVVDIAKFDKKGGPQQAGKRLSVDDVLFGYDLLYQKRKLFDVQRWKGMVMQQDPNDAFAIQDFLWNERPDLMIEFGTNTGGGAVFWAEIMTEYNPDAHIITLDIANRINKSFAGAKGKVKASDSRHWGTTIRPIIGNPDTQDVQDKVEELIRQFGATNVFLNEDSLHSFDVTLAHLNRYHHLTKACGWILVQDTKMSRFTGRDGPVEAVREFIGKNTEYRVDRRWEYLLYTQHAQGWLQKGQKCGKR